jgi:hypothetical protein
MAPPHSRDQARIAKSHALASFEGDDDITSIGIGVSDGSYVVTVTVAHRDALKKLPETILGVPIRASISGEFQRFASN